MANRYDAIEKYKLEIETTAPLHVGSSFGERSEVLVHPLTNLPFVQASSIAGVLRSTSEYVNGIEKTAGLFGSSLQDAADTDTGSRVYISDGEFQKETVRMEYRPRVSIDPVTGTVSSGEISGSGQMSGHKFDMELIGQGARLVFFLYLFHEKQDELKEFLEAVLSEMKAGQILIGGQKSNGSGAFKLISLKHHSFAMDNAADRSDWAVEEEMDAEKVPASAPKYQGISDSLSNTGKELQKFAIKLQGKTESGLLVKGVAAEGVGKDAADEENMRNASGRFIVPGSSLKGALRSRMAYIAEYLGKKEIVPVIFGIAGDKKTRGNNGILQFRDIVMAQHTPTLRQRRIHIDKFTGGVMNGALFSEETISGEIQAEIIVENGNNAEAAAGLLILALRDLAYGIMNLGSGFSVGRGFIQVEKLTIQSLQDGKSAEIQFTEQGNRITRSDDLIKKCLQALQQWGA